MKFICPLVIVENIERSRYLYETVLKQKVKSDFGQNITFQGDFAIHEKDHFATLLNGQEINPGSHTFELYFEEDDLDSVVATLKNENIEFIHDIREQPWRQRVVRFYDYDKNIIEIGETLEHVAWRLSKEGKTVDEICETTYLSKDTVAKAIDFLYR